MTEPTELPVCLRCGSVVLLDVKKAHPCTKVPGGPPIFRVPLIKRWDEMTPSERLLALKGLRENWDSYGGRPISKKALDTASFIVNMRVWPVPRSDGGISLEYQGKTGTEVVVEIAPDGNIEASD